METYHLGYIVDTFEEADWDTGQSAYEEANYHFTLNDFEGLLYKHGLAQLLKDMSEDAAFELLKQAQAINDAA